MQGPFESADGFAFANPPAPLRMTGGWGDHCVPAFPNLVRLAVARRYIGGIEFLGDR